MKTAKPLERVTCTRCKFSAPRAIMLAAPGGTVCANGIACRKRRLKLAAKTAAKPTVVSAPPAPAKAGKAK